MISKQRIKKTHNLSNAEAHVVQNAVYKNQIGDLLSIKEFVAMHLPSHTAKRRRETRSAILLELGTLTH